MWKTCEALRQEGKVGHFILEVFEPFSKDALVGVQNDLYSAYIFYYNLIERQASQELFNEMVMRKCRMISLRALWGGGLNPKGIEKLKKEDPANPVLSRITALEPLFRASGCGTWSEFSVRFVLSHPGIISTVSGTRTLEHLQELLELTRSAKPLKPEIVAAVQKLHR
jgi:aryl-alcohol dehydrogenase-like predicted oxidoreductase